MTPIGAPIEPGSDPTHILVVDDDQRLRDLLGKYLSENGFSVSVAENAADARARIRSLEFDLIVLDLMMPGESGLDFAADLRRSRTIPILMLTAMGEPEDRINGLESGADDYLVKPFEPRELLLRINNILRRAASGDGGDTGAVPEQVNLGVYLFDRVRGELSEGGNPVRLTEQEAALLSTLAAAPGTVFSRDELIERTGAATGGGDGGGRAVDVQVTRLRRKIERNPKLPRYLQTVRGRGYVLRPD